MLKQFHKIQQRLVRELEKKFSGKDVVLIANRRILPPSSTGKATDRPRSRTLTAVRACRPHGKPMARADVVGVAHGIMSGWHGADADCVNLLRDSERKLGSRCMAEPAA